MDKALTWFINGWVTIAVLANIAAIVGFIVSAHSLSSGLTQVLDTYSPFNIINFLAELALFSPAMGAMYWRDKRRASKRLSGTNAKG
jgi:hypothetical protein